MEKAALKIDIPGVDFAQLAREAIAAKLTEAITGNEEIIQKIVVAAMQEKVNEHGVVPRHSYEAKTTYIEWLASDVIRKATLDVLKEKMEAVKPFIEKAVEAELKRSAKASAKLLSDALSKSAASMYGFTAEVVIKARERT